MIFHRCRSSDRAFFKAGLPKCKLEKQKIAEKAEKAEMREAKKQKREVGWGGRLHRGRERPSGQQVRDMMRPCQHDVDGTLWNLVGDLPVFGSNLKINILNTRSVSSDFACVSSAILEL